MTVADLDQHAPRLDQHRLLGWDGMAALVDPAGAIEWWCHPRLDDDPSLWRLLDPDGAVAQWSGAVARRTGDRTVGPSLRTVVEVGGREVACWDALLRHDGRPFIARLVRAAHGPVPVSHHLDASPMRGTSTAVHLRALHGVEERHGPVTTAALEAVPHEWRAVLLGSPSALDAPWTVDSLVEQIEEAEARSANWDAPTSVITIHRERVVVALGVLDACTAAGTGAVIASPTTSLPEVRGADRQFDYRYAWLRDAALAASIAALVGEVGVAGRHVDWLVDRCVACGGIPDPMSAVDGEATPAETALPDVQGWASSRPVRLGNAARDQLQLDGPGHVAEAVWITATTSGRLHRAGFGVVADLADAVGADGQGPSAGIWELREPANVSSADVGRWLLFDRAVRLSWLHEPWAWRRRRPWREARRAARQRFLDGRLPSGAAPLVYGEPHADGAGLLPVVLGLLPASDPVAAELVDGTFRELGHGDPVDALRRYPLAVDDGFHGDAGCFVPVSWWGVSALAQLGRVRAAEELADRLCQSLPGLQGEVIAPDGEVLGNTPLVWSHAEAARALYLLRVAGIRDRAGRVGVAAWRALQLARAQRTGRSSRSQKVKNPS